MTRYCLGFALTRDLTRVVLVDKAYGPAAARGLNGLGGAVLEGVETPLEAMEREWAEETMMDGLDWRHLADVPAGSAQLLVYWSLLDEAFEAWLPTRSDRGEEIALHRARDVIMYSEPAARGVAFLVYLAATTAAKREGAIGEGSGLLRLLEERSD